MYTSFGISGIHGGVPSMYENDMVGIHYSAVCLHYIILDWWWLSTITTQSNEGDSAVKADPFHPILVEVREKTSKLI